MDDVHLSVYSTRKYHDMNGPYELCISAFVLYPGDRYMWSYVYSKYQGTFVSNIKVRLF